MYALKLKPALKEIIWGGTKLIDEYGLKTTGSNIAEAWLLSCHKDGNSIVENGELSGKSFPEALEILGADALGKKGKAFKYFPLLIKIIDAKTDLSVQVHPSDEYALKNEGEFGKTEMWYVMDAEENAKLYYGFKENITKEEFKKHIDAEEVVISPWYFNAFRKEHWTPVESRAEYVAYYNEGDYAKLGIKYVEEDPFLVNVREKAIPLTKEGYRYIPCASVYNRCEYNACDLMEYFKDNAPDDQILGYITAPWYGGEMKNKAFFQESFDTVKAAREIIYGK